MTLDTVGLSLAYCYQQHYISVDMSSSISLSFSTTIFPAYETPGM